MHTDSTSKLVRNNFQGGSLLVIEDNADHWLLIQHGLQTILPEVRLTRVATAQEATDYLQDCVTRQLSLPRLVLLDLYLPTREAGFAFLNAIKTFTPISTLRRLPIVILSSSDHLDDIGQAYESGASSYFTKPTFPQEWTAYFQAIFEYWGRTVTLPDSNAS
ncbi:response regulator [Spirosoma sp. KCTC 42546]|uniref:response regulator n=1 Tax=Spirosoma sp. KCTC 42546 TaxID=2520506 RepID=UPI0011570565|nr:response regulator [Spirosoma sp. KCTC 42546]QDK81653.1 response regulator [Spirosoma sp. KCTC 42546]